MKEHERFLRAFITLFRSVDLDQNGILNEKEFIQLLNEMGAHDQEEVTYFLQILDPFNTQNITFSEIVQLLSSH